MPHNVTQAELISKSSRAALVLLIKLYVALHDHIFVNEKNITMGRRECKLFTMSFA